MNQPMTTTPVPSLQSLLEIATPSKIKLGDRLARPDEFTPWIYYVQSGSLRLLFSSQTNQGILTLRRLEAGDWIGWSNVLSGEPCEWVTAASDATLLAIPAEQATRHLWTNHELMEAVLALPHPHLGSTAATNWLQQQASPMKDPDLLIRDVANQGTIQRFDAISSTNPTHDEPISYLTANWALGRPGTLVHPETAIKGDSEISAPALVWQLPTRLLKGSTINNDQSDDRHAFVGEPEIFVSQADDPAQDVTQVPDAYSLGIRNDKTARLSERYPECCGRGELGRQLAVLEMVAKVYRVPFRRDQLKRRLEAVAKKGRQVNLQTLAK